MSAWKTRNSVPPHACIDAAKNRHVSLDWLYFGIGSKDWQTPPSKPTSTIAEIDAHLEKLTETQRLRILLDIKEMEEANRQKSKLKEMEEEMRREREALPGEQAQNKPSLQRE